MNVLVAALFIAAVLFAFSSNRDVLSPAKLYLGFFLIFYLSSWFSPRVPEYWLLISLVVIAGFYSAIFERAVFNRAVGPTISKEEPPRAKLVTIVVFWVCTIPGVISQAYLIFLAGGLLEYAAAISRRVVEYQGLGWARLLVSTIFSINIVYYAYGVLTRMPRTWWLFYYVHFAILIAFAAVSGSRSALLNIFLAQMLVWHYGRRAIKLKFAAVTALVLIGFAIVLGAVRETTKIEQGEVISTAEDAAVVFRHFSVFSYGVAPIDMLIRSDLRQLQYGSTFLTLITNIIPRPIWPEKPDTGGVFFTKIYANNAWDGLSNMTPTFLGEWVINFGWGIGGLFFVISYSALFFYVIRLNSKIFSSVNRSVEMRSVFIAKYIFIVLAACALLVGEVTNVILGFVFSQYLPLVAVSTLMKLRLRLD